MGVGMCPPPCPHLDPRPILRIVFFVEINFMTHQIVNCDLFYVCAKFQHHWMIFYFMGGGVMEGQIRKV